MADRKLRPLVQFLMMSFMGTIFQLLLFNLSASALLKILAVESKSVWTMAATVVVITVAWIQGNRGGAILAFKPFMGAVLSCLVLNGILLFLYVPISSVLPLGWVFLVTIVLLNYVFSLLGYSFAARTRLHGEPGSRLLFVLSVNYLILLPIIMAGLTIFVIVTRYGLGVPI